MPLDEMRDERAERYDVQALAPRVAQPGLRQSAPEPAPFAGLVDLRVSESDAAVATPVRRKSDQPAGEAELVAALVRDVDDLRIGGNARRGLELVTAVEVLDQLVRCAAFACVAMVGEPAPVCSGELPRLTLVQVRKDLTRAAKQPAVLCLQNGDLVGVREPA